MINKNYIYIYKIYICVCVCVCVCVYIYIYICIFVKCHTTCSLCKVSPVCIVDMFEFTVVCFRLEYVYKTDKSFFGMSIGILFFGK